MDESKASDNKVVVRSSGQTTVTGYTVVARVSRFLPAQKQRIEGINLATHWVELPLPELQFLYPEEHPEMLLYTHGLLSYTSATGHMWTLAAKWLVLLPYLEMQLRAHELELQYRVKDLGVVRGSTVNGNSEPFIDPSCVDTQHIQHPGEGPTKP